MNRRYYGYLYTIAYLMLLRIVIHITTGISVFNFGVLFDLVLVMFWVGAVSFFLKKLWMQKVFYSIIIVLSTVIVIADSLYNEYFGIISSIQSLRAIYTLQAGQTLEYNLQIPLVGYLVTPILIATLYLIITKNKQDVFKLRDFGLLSIVFVVQVGLFLYWGFTSYETPIEYYRSDAYLYETMHDRKLYSERYGYYNYHMLDIVRIRKPRDPDIVEADIDAYFNEKTHDSNSMTNQYDGYNVITILLESFDTRFISEELTPNLYMLKNEGMYFDTYYTPVFNQGATCNSEFMSLTGLQAISSNDWSSNICDSYSTNPFPYALPSQLREDGYHTYYFHSGYEWFYDRETMIPNYGFETVKFQEDLYDAGYSDFNERYDTDMMYFVEEFVSFDEPFYMNFLTYSGHGAYNQTDFNIHLDQVEQAFPDNGLDYQIINYMEKLVETDLLIGELLATLETEGILDETLFVVYPDHWPYMMDNEIYSDYLGIDLDSYELKKQELIFYTPSMTPQVIHTTGSTMDITPTILNMVYGEANFSYFMGVDLFGTNENFVLFSDLTITNGSTYLTLDEQLIGVQIDPLLLETPLEQLIYGIEMQRLILESDYFNEFKED